MVVLNRDSFWLASNPAEGNPPLIVYSNGPILFALSAKLFKPVTRRAGQVAHINGSIQKNQFTQHKRVQIFGEAATGSGLPEGRRFRVVE
jgi:hypothetical protein